MDKLRNLYPVEKYPDGTVDLAIAIDNRAVSLSRLKDFAEAARLAEEANGMFAALAKRSPGLRLNFARSSATLALLNARLQRYDVAIKNLSTAIEAYEEMFQGGHAELPGLYRSKAIILSEMRRPEEAIEAAQRSLQLARTQFPNDDYPDGHWILAQSLDNTGLIYLAAERTEEAAHYFSEAVKMQNQLARQALKYISEAESLQFLAIADTFQSHLLSVPSDPAKTYQLLSSAKGRILDQQKERFQNARESTDPQQAQLYEQYEQVRRNLANLLLRPSNNPENAQLLNRLQQARESLERQLAGDVQNEGAESKRVEGDESSYQLSSAFEFLQDDEAVVEFYSYEHYTINDEADFRRTEGEQRICAFVIDPKTKSVKRLEFGEALAIRRDVRRLVAAMQYGTEQQPLDDLAKTIGDPLVEYIPTNCKRLYIIPDDIISSVPFACLQSTTTEQPLVQRVELSFLTSLDSIETTGSKFDSTMKVVGVGAIDYGPVQDDQPIQFFNLPGTRTELDTLSKRVSPSNWIELTGAEVTPEILLNAIESGELIHLATHAYVSSFARNAVTNNGLETGAIRDTAAERSPLLATKMALSGANDPAKNAVVTGDQFVSADLSQSKLVVLSACESGVGERVLGEGVFGLQRAFHVAGAKHVIATLWPVSDADAVMFMDAFYSGLIDEQLSPASALRRAQLEMLNLPPNRGESQPRMIALRGIKFNIPKDPDAKQPSDNATAARSDAAQGGSARSTWGAFFLSVD